MDFIQIKGKKLDLPDEEFLKYISTLKVNINLIQIEYKPLIFILINEGKLNLIETLTRLEGLNLNIIFSTYNEQTTLHYACELNKLDIVKFLLDQGVNPSNKCKNGDTPLHISCFEGNIEIVSLLLDRGADVHSKDVYGCTPLYSCSYDLKEELISLLLDRGADINSQNTYGCSLIHYTCGGNNTKITSFLLDRGADVNIKDKNGQTPLHTSCWHGNVKGVKLLLERGAKIEYENGDPTCLSGRISLNISYEKFRKLSDVILNYRMGKIKGISREEK